MARGAVHLHNGFLEVAYNNGMLGELLLLTIHFMMLRNIFSSMKTCKILRNLRPFSEQAWHAYLLTIGCLALYVHTFLQGLLGGHFGGRCMSPYMLWLALAMLTAADPPCHRDYAATSNAYPGTTLFRGRPGHIATGACTKLSRG